jgi:hypothetical protein
MLSIDEYRKTRDHFMKCLSVWALGVIAAGIGTGLIAVALGRLFHVSERYTALFGAEKAAILESMHPMVGMAVVLAGSFVMHSMTKKARRHSRLFCPHCTNPIVYYPSLVIATRNCPWCGRRVLAEPEEKPKVAADDLGDLSLL